MIVALRLDGGERTALVRAVQRDPLSHEILHLDFQEVSLTERVRVEVPVHLVGVPAGVKDQGGILQHITRSLELECLATDIPSHIDADVSALLIGDSIHVRDLVIEKVEILSEGDDTVAAVVPPTVLEAPPVEAVEPEAAEPEVIAKGKEEKPEEAGE
jgi:large subunit ribosomal protein L25